MTALLAFLALLTFTPDLTKEDVKKLVAAGVSDDVIVSVIRARGPMRGLSVDDMIDLRNANVSDKVLAAMVEASKLPNVTAPDPSEYGTATYPGYYGYDSYYYPSYGWTFGLGYGYGYGYRYPHYSCYPYRTATPYGYGYRSYPYGHSWAPVPHQYQSPRGYSNPRGMPSPSHPSPAPHSGGPRGGGHR